MKISKNIESLLQCPKTKASLELNGNFLESSVDSSNKYPIINDIPILINESRSLFSIHTYEKGESTTINYSSPSAFKKILRRLTPSISNNLVARSNYQFISNKIPNNARILFIGGSSKGYGSDYIYSNNSYDIVGLDVSVGEYTDIVADAHDIPFVDQSFDLIVIQAVIEHVIDPIRCVEEAYRVLKNGGIIYSESPFMQQVHMREYDFTRYSYLGMLKLFAQFNDIKSGICCGPGMALAWSYTYFLRSFSTNKKIIRLITIFAYSTSFYLKYIDRYLVNKSSAYIAASGFYFIGVKDGKVSSDIEILESYRGV